MICQKAEMIRTSEHRHKTKHNPTANRQGVLVVSEKLKTKQQKPQLKKVADHKARLLQELTKAKGNISIACANTGLDRTTYYRFVKDDPAFAERVDDIKEAAIDHVESKLHELIDGVTVQKELKSGETFVYTEPPNTAAVCFFLKCQAKKRGYIERQEVTGAGGKDLIPSRYDLSKLSTAELVAFRAMQDKIEIKDEGNG